MPTLTPLKYPDRSRFTVIVTIASARLSLLVTVKPRIAARSAEAKGLFRADFIIR